MAQPEIDLLHRRIGINVFMQNYFNPALIYDMKERTLKAAKEIQMLVGLPYSSMR